MAKLRCDRCRKEFDEGLLEKIPGDTNGVCPACLREIATAEEDEDLDFCD